MYTMYVSVYKKSYVYRMPILSKDESMIMSIQTQKTKQHKKRHSTKWNAIKQERLRKLTCKSEKDLTTLLSSIPQARFETWCQQNQVRQTNSRHILYCAIMQSWLGHEVRELHSVITFYRDSKTEYTNKIYEHLFYKKDPRLDGAEEICKYLDCLK